MTGQLFQRCQEERVPLWACLFYCLSLCFSFFFLERSFFFFLFCCFCCFETFAAAFAAAFAAFAAAVFASFAAALAALMLLLLLFLLLLSAAFVFCFLLFWRLMLRYEQRFAIRFRSTFILLGLFFSWSIAISICKNIFHFFVQFSCSKKPFLTGICFSSSKKTSPRCGHSTCSWTESHSVF